MALLRRLLCTLLRIFYRRIDVAGREHVPDQGPVIFVLNHPNALMDPLVLLCRTRRRVSFLAKEPLFRMPLVGTLVRAMDSIPVWRRMDQADTSKNRPTFVAARSVLARGGTIALFPEGRSHHEPRLLPFRTGAARIALGAAGNGLLIVPAGLYYTAKDVFRSAVLLCFGPPLPVEPVALGADEEPPAEPVRVLTQRLEHALAELTLQADRHRAIALVEAAEAMLVTATGAPPEDLAPRFQARQRILQGYERLRREAPDELAALSRRVARYQATLRASGLTSELLPARGYRTARVIRVTLGGLGVLLVLLPAALAGIVVNAPTYFLIRWISMRYAGVPDARASVKAVAGLVLYPITWLALALGLWRWAGLLGGLAGLGLGLPTGLAALVFLERLQPLVGGARGVLLALLGRRRFLRLLAERRRIRNDLLALARRLGV